MRTENATSSPERDRRLLPAYTTAEAARILKAPEGTLRKWAGGDRSRQPIIRRKAGYLSFVGLVEAHVLNSLRRNHQIPLAKIRRAVAWLRGRLDTPHPLAHSELYVDGGSRDLLVEFTGRLVSASEGGQRMLSYVMKAHLTRVRFGDDDLASTLYPFTQPLPCGAGSLQAAEKMPQLIVVDPTRCFGSPMIESARVRVSVVVDRFQAGDSMASLAKEFGCTRGAIEEALRFAGAA